MNEHATTFDSLRSALQPRGTEAVVCLRLKAGCAVDHALVEKAIEEIRQQYVLERVFDEKQTACMKLAKILLLDSSYLEG
jgi:hypothetical protein